MADMLGVFQKSGERDESAAEAWARFAALAGDKPPAPRPMLPRLLSSIWTRLTGARDAVAVARHVGASRSVVLDQPHSTWSATSGDGSASVTLLGDWIPRSALSERSNETPGSPQGAAGALKAYRASGEEAVSEAAGSWACAIHDHGARTLTLLRGRDAPPQLYYFERDGFVWFGSRLPTMRRLPDFPRDPALDAVSFYLAFGFPPLDRALFAGVHRLEPGGALRVAPGTMRRARHAPSADPAAVDELESDPIAAFQSAVEAAMAPLVAGKRVAVIGAPSDPRTSWLAQAVERAGAASVVLSASEQISGFQSIETVLEAARRLISREGEAFASPALIALAARAAEHAGAVDLCISSEGSHTLLPTARRYGLLAKRLAHMGGGRKSALRRSAFHAGSEFSRDFYFDQLAVFDDASRLAVAGPLLAPWNLFAMADELGPTLEGATPDTAPERAWSLDDCFLGPGSLQPALDAASRAAGTAILAPFLTSSVRTHVRALRADAKAALGRAFRLWPDEPPEASALERLIADGESEVRNLLDPNRFLGRSLFGRVALNELLERHFDGASPNGRRVWALCCLELWFQECVDRRP